MHARPQTSLAGTGDEPGPVIKSKAEAAALNKLFVRGESDPQFAANKPGPSYNDFRAIRARLEALDRDRNCSKLQFLDRQGRKWSVAYHDSEKRACLVDEEARLESRTACSVPSSTHINNFTFATHMRGHCRHDVNGRGPRASLDTFALKTTCLVQTSNPKLPLAGTGNEPGPAIKTEAEASAWTTCFTLCEAPRPFAVGDPGPSLNDIQPLLSKLKGLGSDSGCSMRSFLDSADRKWVVKIHFTEKRVSLKAAGTSSGVFCSFTHVPCMYI